MKAIEGHEVKISVLKQGKKGKLLLMLGLLALCIVGYVCLRSMDWKEPPETDSSFNVQSISEAIEEAEEETAEAEE